MNNEPIKIGRISARIEKALGYSLGDNVFCYIREAKLREFANKWPTDYLKKIEEASNIIKEPLYVGIDKENKKLYLVKDYIVKNAFFRKACLVMDFSQQLQLVDITMFDDKKMAELGKTTKIVATRS